MSDENTSTVEGEAQPGVLIPRGHFSVHIQWGEGVTEEEQKAAFPFIQELTEQVALAEKDQYPLVINAITVKRD